uniref:De novo synthetic protein DIG8-CC n=1 Tax=synthetic construct TaxID=32630 RepID=UPI0021D69F3A|nr:Chain A, De novo synthetic protein DIG8-CC [synthetic construct]7SKN_B Chain B, De novo synthetic protein DIG8-CC [synthetic construct]7SKN_C Chain C, De novo synthetic protein DIG8-CC [synthetic construct]7SKN_D Chain D, De novo synthetic protein DIG8-CC [synthetic construct]7SKO_A Chain A, De novo synthetic protein DIG8-CC [synthetic construct]7SKO_B Chain B, De novo synthetic protein DIG8-CC [synthetic construct]7SKO_C Chain C, De novo synthetic protein DIG8-CC [synthetic construct]7SK
GHMRIEVRVDNGRVRVRNGTDRPCRVRVTAGGETREYTVNPGTELEVELSPEQQNNAEVEVECGNEKYRFQLG